MQYSQTILEKYEARPRLWWLYTIIIVLVAILLAWSGSTIHFQGITSKGTEVASGIFYGLIQPNWSMLFSTAKDGVPYLLMETVSSAASLPCRLPSWLPATSCPSPWPLSSTP